MRTTAGKTLTMLGAVVATAGLLLAGGPALASSHATTISRGKITTGPEVIYGTIHGKAATVAAPVIPLRLAGLVNAVGSVTLGGGNSKRHHLNSSAGRLNIIQTGKPQQKETENTATCYLTFTEAFALNVTGGTGKFTGASGPGAVQVYFAGFAKRYKSGPHKGQCNPNSQPYPAGAVASFLLTVALTVK